MRRVIALILAAACLAALAALGDLEFGSSSGPPVSESRHMLPRRLSMRETEQDDPAFLRIFTAASELERWMQDGSARGLFQVYPICPLPGELGLELKMGDRQAPEGFDRVRLDQLSPNGRRRLSFDLGFPGAFDRVHGRAGGFLMVYGGWSFAGCDAVTNGAVAVLIFPFRVTEANMAGFPSDRRMEFRRNLKDGDDALEANGRIPSVTVRDGRYEFGGSALAGREI